MIGREPGQTPRVQGPFTLTQATKYITPRLRGRLVSIKFESNDIDTFWRIGAPRYRDKISTPKYRISSVTTSAKVSALRNAPSSAWCRKRGSTTPSRSAFVAT